MDWNFIAGLGVGLSIGLGIALRILTARDPAPRITPKPREPSDNRLPVPFTGSNARREELTR